MSRVVQTMVGEGKPWIQTIFAPFRTRHVGGAQNTLTVSSAEE